MPQPGSDGSLPPITTTTPEQSSPQSLCMKTCSGVSSRVPSSPMLLKWMSLNCDVLQSVETGDGLTEIWNSSQLSPSTPLDFRLSPSMPQGTLTASWPLEPGSLMTQILDADAETMRS